MLTLDAGYILTENYTSQDVNTCRSVSQCLAIYFKALTAASFSTYRDVVSTWSSGTGRMLMFLYKSEYLFLLHRQSLM